MCVLSTRTSVLLNLRNRQLTLHTCRHICPLFSRMVAQALAKYKKLKSERTDVVEEFNRDREDMLDTIRMHEKELMLKDLIIENFIPPEEVQRV